MSVTKRSSKVVAGRKDRRGLVQRSCECYGISKREFDLLLGERGKRKVR